MIWEERFVMPNIRALLLLSLLNLSLTPATFAAPVKEVIVGGAEGYVRLDLDKSTIKADEPVRGHVIFKIESVRDRFGKQYDAIELHDPTVDVTVPDSMAAAMHEVIFPRPLQPTIKVGHEYRLPFQVRMKEDFRKLLRKPGEPYVLHQPGMFNLQAAVHSPPILKNEPRRNSPFAMLTQVFKSKSVSLTIQPAAIDAPKLKKSHITHAIDQSTDDLRHRIIAFHVRKGDLSHDDLLSYITDASDRDKAKLADFYLSRNLPVAALKDFKKPGASVHFEGHDQPPVFFLMEPRQQLRMTFKVDGLHRMRIADLDKLIIANTKIDFTAPTSMGLYEMRDPRHQKAWGWILVHGETSRTPSDKLRPDTKAISQSVATALFKGDNDALAALAAPDFRTGDVIRKMKFKLGSGDIRYFKSSGTKNKVKTRMRVNIAEQGEEPVFAHELILEFVRIGSDLKLTQALITDVD